MRIVIAPLEFKGSLTAEQAAAAMQRGLEDAFPTAELVVCPMADGGPGTLDVLSAALKATVHEAVVSDALGRPTTARWASIGDQSALIETAQAIGLSQLDVDERDLEVATSRGAGELLRAALDSGASQLFVAVGGSATNDGGKGLLEALGVHFTGSQVDTGGLDPRLRKVEIIVLADVRNPLLGGQGATMMYATQKGAPDERLADLEQRMQEFADQAESAFGTRVRELPGSGAAGGLGFGLLLLNGRVLAGAEVVSQLVGLRELLKDSDLLLTGEGALDAQTAWGKGVSYLTELARRSHVAAYGIFGRVRGSLLGLEEVISLEEQAGSIDLAIANAEAEVEKAAQLFGKRLKDRENRR